MALTAAEIAELSRLSTQELLKLRNSLMQDVQDLYYAHLQIASEMDPERDQEILDVFKKLDLREDLLPEIQRILEQRARSVSRAA